RMIWLFTSYWTSVYGPLPAPCDAGDVNHGPAVSFPGSRLPPCACVTLEVTIESVGLVTIAGIAPFGAAGGSTTVYLLGALTVMPTSRLAPSPFNASARL